MRKSLFVGASLLVALAATAQNAPVENYAPSGLISPNWAYPYRFNVRMVEGGRNSAGEAQLFSCSERELLERTGRCAALPPDREIEFGTPIRIDDQTPHRMAEYLGPERGWRIRDRALAKTTQGLVRGRYVKRSPGQGALISLQGVNAAQGDFMGLAMALNDPAGGQAAGDEGLMPLMIFGMVA